jgi:hypothetical protein
MSDFEITCTTRGTEIRPGHSHIESVGLRGEDGAFTVQQIYRLIAARHRVYTVSPSSGASATVRPWSAAAWTRCGLILTRYVTTTWMLYPPVGSPPGSALIQSMPCVGGNGSERTGSEPGRGWQL